jgi:hypothetical protein
VIGYSGSEEGEADSVLVFCATWSRDLVRHHLYLQNHSERFMLSPTVELQATYNRDMVYGRH